MREKMLELASMLEREPDATLRRLAVLIRGLLEPEKRAGFADALRQPLREHVRDVYENGAPIFDEHGEPTGERAKLPTEYLPLAGEITPFAHLPPGRKPAIEIACPECHAQPGEPCKGMKIDGFVHAVRL